MINFLSSSAGGLSREQARAWALEAGFAEAGLAALPYADEARDAARFEEWVRKGRAGTMRYLARTGEDGRLLRARVGNAFPWARSAWSALLVMRVRSRARRSRLRRVRGGLRGMRGLGAWMFKLPKKLAQGLKPTLVQWHPCTG